MVEGDPEKVCVILCVRHLNLLHVAVMVPGGFYVLTGIFNQMVIRKNEGKTVGWLCRPCRAVVEHSYAAYGRCMTGEGPTYQAYKNHPFQ